MRTILTPVSSSLLTRWLAPAFLTVTLAAGCGGSDVDVGDLADPTESTGTGGEGGGGGGAGDPGHGGEGGGGGEAGDPGHGGEGGSGGEGGDPGHGGEGGSGGEGGDSGHGGEGGSGGEGGDPGHAGEGGGGGEGGDPGHGGEGGAGDVCTKGATQCSGTNVEVCTGGGWDFAESCALGCADGACVSSGSCTPGERRCSGTSVEICNASGSAFLHSQTCSVSCTAGLCTGACEPGTRRCNGGKVEECNTGGTAWSFEEGCSSGVCDDSTASCALSPVEVTSSLDWNGEVVVHGPVVVKAGATLTSSTGDLTLRATSIIVEAGGAITVSPTGTRASGSSGSSYSCAGTGGGYGTAGVATTYCTASGGSVYGSAADATVEMGGRGGNSRDGGGIGGNGGGQLRLIAPTITIAGQLRADGQNGGNASNGGGGGSGGGILLAADNLVVSGQISTAGGAGGLGTGVNYHGTAGGQGRVKLLYGERRTITGTITGVKTETFIPPLRITSSTHPDPSLVYNDDFPSIALSWERPFPSVGGYWYRLSTTQVQLPKSGPETALTLDEYTSIPRSGAVNGQNWFHILSANSEYTEGTAENRFGIYVTTTPPTLKSSTHTSQTSWNANGTVQFTWTPPFDDKNFKGYHYVVDQYGTTVPTKSDTFLNITQRALPRTLTPGIWAMHIVTQDRQGYLTKAAAHYVVRIGENPGQGGLLGSVVDGASNNVPGAIVTINRGLLRASLSDQTTSSTGSYNFGSNVPAGTWEVQVSKEGYATQTKTVTVTPGGSSAVNFTLSP